VSSAADDGDIHHSVIVLATRPGRTAVVMAGMGYGLIVYIVMYWVLLRNVFSLWASQGVSSFLSANPEWAWIAGHLAFGMVLGAIVAYRPLWLTPRTRSTVRPAAG
jgi:hypothetical protein